MLWLMLLVDTVNSVHGAIDSIECLRLLCKSWEWSVWIVSFAEFYVVYVVYGGLSWNVTFLNQVHCICVIVTVVILLLDERCVM